MLGSTSHGAWRTRAALRAKLGDAVTSALTVADLFGTHLDRYAELIASPDSELTGFMTRGDDRELTARTAAALEYLGLERDALEHHAALAGWMEHRRGFTKVEWTREGDDITPLVAIYFRRRPAISDVLARMTTWGISAPGRELVSEIAGILDKRSVHFVASAFRPRSLVHHKLYFSQLVANDTHVEIARRVERVLKRFGATPAQIAHWQRQHEATVDRNDSTIFVSVSMTAENPSPSFKIDYPEVEPQRAAAWVRDNRPSEGAARDACNAAGTTRLSYLGVRFHAERELPSLKFYCDVPSLADTPGLP